MTSEQIEDVLDNIALGNFVNRIMELDQRIADCHTRRKAAIMRAAQAVREMGLCTS